MKSTHQPSHSHKASLWLPLLGPEDAPGSNIHLDVGHTIGEMGVSFENREIWSRKKREANTKKIMQKARFQEQREHNTGGHAENVQKYSEIVS